MRQTKSLFLVLLVVAMVTAACSGEPTSSTTASPDGTATTDQPSTTSSTATSTPEELPTITIAAAEDPETLESANARQASRSTVLRNIHEPLIDRDPSSNEFIPALATSWEQVDPLTWRFQIREGVTFHDGSQLNAEAAAVGLSWVWSADNEFLIRSFVVSEMTFSAVDEYTLEVTSEEPDPLLLERLWLSTLPSAQQILEDPDSYVDTPIGTGPYKFVSWDRGNEVVLEANHDWWGLSSEDGRGEINFSTATFLVRPESSSRIAALQAGEALFAEGLAPEACLDGLGEDCQSAPKSDIAFIKLDTNNPVLADERVRMAMSLAIDRVTISSTVLGNAEPASQLVGPGVLGFNPALEPHPYDPDQAALLIEEARADGVPFDDFPLRLTILQNGFPGDEALQQVILEALRGIGMENVTAEIQETDIFVEELRVNIADAPPERGLMQLAQHNNRFGDMSSTAALYLTCGAVASTWCDADADALHEQASGTSDRDERAELYEEYNRLYYEANPYINIANMPFFHGVASSLSWIPRADGVILLKDMSVDG